MMNNVVHMKTVEIEGEMPLAKYRASCTCGWRSTRTWLTEPDVNPDHASHLRQIFTGR